ncbi:bifunctional ATP-dependent DNA helicase/DNA polymerase III subunit epsilon [Serratia fonticola]|uniref:Bifunctional ATP-dependent DNA helicase/DNA polymerase III subunit epsilon n=1 Tax=Serratia fonticola TaxID=47917 RepID=A0A4U9TGT6_SERFO|nr:bifunctional ATP-dependent DNA helicase/DNA polymerase III subunit epsilon [Serratia fonticola]
MAEAVTEAINFKQELVVEAGTGTGKTYAYLAPALRFKAQGNYFHRLQGLAGSALRPRSAHRGQGIKNIKASWRC